jgi:hypothetical protein
MGRNLRTWGKRLLKVIWVLEHPFESEVQRVFLHSSMKSSRLLPALLNTTILHVHKTEVLTSSQ